MRRIFSVAVTLILVGAVVSAHPHFDKTITAKLPSGATVTIAYNTTPSNETRATSAAVGQFVTPRAPKLTLSTEVKAGAVTVPAGEYTIGVIKNTEKDWTMALYPGRPPQAGLDMSKVIKLESAFDGGVGLADHMLIDITPGKGKFVNRAVLTLHFGTLYLSGALG